MAVMAKEAQVSMPSDREVRVVRSFQAPRALVYEAYVTPALLQRWLTAQPGWSMPVCEMDVRVGGAFRWRWRSDEGQEFGFHGVFRVVEPPSKLVHTEIFDHGPIENRGDWTAPLPPNAARYVSAIGLRTPERFVSIVHTSS